ncbi:hypothetical protein CHUAL_014258 [Chamberlinius hualienensis]
MFQSKRSKLKMSEKLIIILCVLFCKSESIVITQYGKIQGYRSFSTSGKPYDSFLAIPYAKPPINELRFKPPEPLDKWEGIRNGSADGPICPQPSLKDGAISGEEDCLYLNVYVSKINDDTKNLLPVMFYIHGGGWSYESGSLSWYGPQNYMDYPIILVTFNYRIGALGFLSTNDSSSKGNYGMLDQVLALKWVKNNIMNFGGDPRRITIFGNSVGSSSVAFHLLSPLSKGLFQKAIAESGMPTVYWGYEPNPLKMAKMLAALLNCSYANSALMIKCISTKSAKEIVEAQAKLLISGFFPVNFRPVIDGANGFLPEPPLSLMTKTKIANRVPIIIGCTEKEGYSFWADLSKTFRYAGREYFVKQFPETLAAFSPIQPNMTKIVNAIADRYWKHNSDLNDSSTFTDVFSTVQCEHKLIEILYCTP